MYFFTFQALPTCVQLYFYTICFRWHMPWVPVAYTYVLWLPRHLLPVYNYMCAWYISGEACLWVPGEQADGRRRLGGELWVLWAADICSERQVTGGQHQLGSAGSDGCQVSGHKHRDDTTDEDQSINQFLFYVCSQQGHTHTHTHTHTHQQQQKSYNRQQQQNYISYTNLPTGLWAISLTTGVIIIIQNISLYV